MANFTNKAQQTKQISDVSASSGVDWRTALASHRERSHAVHAPSSFLFRFRGILF
jgi:hypothetical protein